MGFLHAQRNDTREGKATHKRYKVLRSSMTDDRVRHIRRFECADIVRAHFDRQRADCFFEIPALVAGEVASAWTARYTFRMERVNLDLDIPLLQAPIGSCSNPILAAAVSNAGGMGGIAGTWTAPDALRAIVADTRARTSKPFFVNFALVFPCPALSAALEAGSSVVTFSWGIPDRARTERVRSYGAQFGVQISNADGAARAVDQGADFLIAQGIESGGHVQATRPLTQVLAQVMAVAGDVPVFATGGIATGAAIADAMRHGASGAMMGTRFLATHESLAHPRYQQLLVESKPGDAVHTICFDRTWPSAPHRVLRNATLDGWETAGCAPFGARPGESDVLAHRDDGVDVPRYDDTPPLRSMTGNIDEMCLYAGTGAADIHDVQPAGALVAELWRDCQRALAAAPRDLQQ
jgi:nitronate monooxygenase